MRLRAVLAACGACRRTQPLPPLSTLLACLACLALAATKQDGWSPPGPAARLPSSSGGRIGSSTGSGGTPQAISSGRRLRATCPPFPLIISNGCSVYTLQVAVRAQLSQDAAAGFCTNNATKAGEWCMRRWFVLDRFEQATPFPDLTNPQYYLYAEAMNSTTTWSGNASAPLFSLTTGEPCAVKSATCQPFVQKQALVDGSCPTQWSDTLFCPAAEDALVTNCAMSLFFENTCRYPIRFAVRAVLNNDEEPGFCLGGNRTKGDWCTRAWFDLPPAQTTSGQLLQMGTNRYYFWAEASDDKNRSVRWAGSSVNPSTAWINAATGGPCTQGSSADCRPFRANTTDCAANHTATVNCNIMLECTIPNCQTYSPDGLECVCSACAPGYWGGSCTACSVPTCQRYSSGCACESCDPGFYASSGSCTPCAVSNCGSYLPGDACTCSTCSAGYSLSNGACKQAQCSVHVVNCQAYSATNGCACTACTAGYRLASGSCEPCAISGCQAYLTASQCSCTACASGYQASGGGCLSIAGTTNTTTSSSNVGVIAGAAAGAAVAVAAAAALAIFLYHRRRKRQARPDEEVKPNIDSLLVPPSGPSGGGSSGGGTMGFPGGPPLAYGALLAGSPMGTAAGSTAGSPGSAGQQLQSLGPSPFASAYGQQATLVGAADVQPEGSLATFPTRPGSSPPMSVASMQAAAFPAAHLSTARAAGLYPCMGTGQCAPPCIGESADKRTKLAMHSASPGHICPVLQDAIASGATQPQSLSSASAGASLHSVPGTAATPPLSATASAGTAGGATAGSAGTASRSAMGTAGTAPRSAVATGGTAPCSAVATAGTSPPSSLLPAGLSVPTTPSAPSRDGTSAIMSGLSSGSAASRDPLMTYLQSQVVPIGSTRTSGQPHTPGSPAGVDVRPWEVHFDELQILKPIGEGSFGRVYLAEWFSTQVAVKVLIVGHVANASDAQRALSLSVPILHKLEAEASLLASLRHPNVVNFLGICHDPPAILTEYCARGSLTEVLAAGRTDPAAAAQLTWARRLAMAVNAASGMLYLHSRPAPIVHRDLKSPNLLVDANWTAKVTDFNLSKILEDATHSSSMAAMNPRWLAPELMMGQRATKASDVYAFGIVMWELMTWHLPWGTANPWQLVSHVTAGGRLEVPPRQALPGPDTATFVGLDDYVALMQRCWAQAPADRPGFQEIVVQLRGLMEQAAMAWAL